MEFYSYDGYPATPGHTGGTGNTGNTGSTGGTEDEGETTTPEPDYSYEIYSGFSGIPTFDQFSSSDRTSLSSSSSHTAGYLDPSATQEELNAYMAVLEACGFTSHGSIGTMTMYGKAHPGHYLARKSAWAAQRERSKNLAYYAAGILYCGQKDL